MSAGFPLMAGATQARLRRNWGWFLVLGILLILAGVAAIRAPFMASFATVKVTGYLLLFGAGVEIASGIWTGTWGGFFLHMLCGLLYLFLGIEILDRPLEAMAVYTLILAMFFVASGLIRAIYSLAHRFHGWGWMLLSGLVTFVLGVMIWRQWPEAALWVIGLFVGIDLIFIGWSWVMLALVVHSLPVAATKEPST
jgi:uncharacterized membrane protein HdeD (DUF308 family)